MNRRMILNVAEEETNKNMKVKKCVGKENKHLYLPVGPVSRTELLALTNNYSNSEQMHFCIYIPKIVRIFHYHARI